MIKDIRAGAISLLPILLAISLALGCTGSQTFISLEEVTTVTADEVLLLPEDNVELVTSLLESYNSAKYRRTANSGPSTNKLVLTISDGTVYSFYRIDEDIVEVSLRHEDMRRKFFLESKELSELIRSFESGQ